VEVLTVTETAGFAPADVPPQAAAVWEASHSPSYRPATSVLGPAKHPNWPGSHRPETQDWILAMQQGLQISALLAQPRTWG